MGGQLKDNVLISVMLYGAKLFQTLENPPLGASVPSLGLSNKAVFCGKYVCSTDSKQDTSDLVLSHNSCQGPARGRGGVSDKKPLCQPPSSIYTSRLGR